ncbi:hypothetical protein, partial [Escherichia coli]|uniref:hypothetical protein n=1 Tax=Escherichia coli TaxID=562 RepID=UPI00215A7229
ENIQQNQWLTNKSGATKKVSAVHRPPLCKKWKTLPWRRNAALYYDKARRIFLRWARALPAPAHERTDMLDAPTIL